MFLSRAFLSHLDGMNCGFFDWRGGDNKVHFSGVKEIAGVGDGSSCLFTMRAARRCSLRYSAVPLVAQMLVAEFDKLSEPVERPLGCRNLYGDQYAVADLVHLVSGRDQTLVEGGFQILVNASTFPWTSSPVPCGYPHHAAS
jgi:hypothetical protein